MVLDEQSAHQTVKLKFRCSEPHNKLSEHAKDGWGDGNGQSCFFVNLNEKKSSTKTGSIQSVRQCVRVCLCSMKAEVTS